MKSSAGTRNQSRPTTRRAARTWEKSSHNPPGGTRRSALHETALRQADLLIAHNITAQDDIDALGKTKQAFMTGSKDIQKIVSTMEWRRGLSAIFDDKTRKVEYCKIRPRLSLHTGTDATLLQ